jgi:hypothetical protein
MSEAPAGWYPDPEVPGQQRYWDGASWTEHRAPGQQASQWAGQSVGQPVGQWSGQQTGQWAAPPPTAGNAVAALVCGILSLVMCGFFTGIPAMILGRRAKREVEASAGQLGGEGIATAGFVTGLIGTLLWGIPLLIVLVIAIGSVAAGA